MNQLDDLFGSDLPPSGLNTHNQPNPSTGSENKSLSSNDSAESLTLGAGSENNNLFGGRNRGTRRGSTGTHLAGNKNNSTRKRLGSHGGAGGGSENSMNNSDVSQVSLSTPVTPSKHSGKETKTGGGGGQKSKRAAWRELRAQQKAKVSINIPVIYMYGIWNITLVACGERECVCV